MKGPIRSSSSDCEKGPTKRRAETSDEIISSMTVGCSIAELWFLNMREESMLIDELRGKPDSMPLTTSKNWSKMPRSSSAERPRAGMSGVTMGKACSSLAVESPVL